MPLQEGGTSLQRQHHHLAQEFQSHCKQLQQQLFQKESDVQKKFEALLAWVNQVAQQLAQVQAKEEEAQIIKEKVSEAITGMTLYLQNLDWTNTPFGQHVQEHIGVFNEKLQEIWVEFIPQMESRVSNLVSRICEMMDKNSPEGSDFERVTLTLENVQTEMQRVSQGQNVVEQQGHFLEKMQKLSHEHILTLQNTAGQQHLTLQNLQGNLAMLQEEVQGMKSGYKNGPQPSSAVLGEMDKKSIIFSTNFCISRMNKRWSSQTCCKS